MAITRLTAQDAKGQSGTTTVSATYPSVPTQGNLLIAHCFQNGTATSSIVTMDNAGWTLLARNTGTSVDVAVYYKIAGAAEPQTVQCSCPVAGLMKIHLYEYSGMNPSAPIGTFSTWTGASALTATSAGISAGQGQMAVSVFSVNGNIPTAPTITPPFTIMQVDTTSIRLWSAYYEPSSTALQQCTSTWTTNNRLSRGIDYRIDPAPSSTGFLAFMM